MEQTKEEHSKDEQTETNQKEGDKEMKHNKKASTSELEEKLKTAEDEAFDWKNKYYMVLADMQNLRKSLEEDHRNAIRYRSEGFLENLLPALDGFFMALNSPVNTPEAKNYQQGFIYIYNQIQNALESEGVTEILPKVGDPFDANSMNAVDVVDGDEENDGKIALVFSKGYRLHEKMIRPANVKVFKKKVVENTEDNKDSNEKANVA